MTTKQIFRPLTHNETLALDHDALVEATTAYLATRDLRCYGIYSVSLQDSLKQAEIAQAEPVERIDALFALYSQVLPTMSNLEVREIALKARKCPPRPVR